MKTKTKPAPIATTPTRPLAVNELGLVVGGSGDKAGTAGSNPLYSALTQSGGVNPLH